MNTTAPGDDIAKPATQPQPDAPTFSEAPRPSLFQELLCDDDGSIHWFVILLAGLLVGMLVALVWPPSHHVVVVSGNPEQPDSTGDDGQTPANNDEKSGGEGGLSADCQPENKAPETHSEAPPPLAGPGAAAPVPPTGEAAPVAAPVVP